MLAGLWRPALGCLAVLPFLAFNLAACVQVAGDYPRRAVEIVTLDPAGGPTDIVARSLANSAQPSFPQPLVVVNKPGGAGTIAAAQVVRAQPDGYTIGLQAVGPMALQPHRTELPYGKVDDYRPVINLVRQPLVLAVRADAPWKSLPDLLAAGRLNPGTIRAALPGSGTIADVNLDLLAAKAGATLGRVHFNSAPEAVRALLGGDVEAAVVGPPALISHVQTGTVRVLGVFEENRNPNFPDAPTFRELGYDVVLGGYFFIIAPRGTPDSVVDTLHGVFKQAMEDEQFRTIVTRSGFVLDYQDGASLGMRLAKDYELFGELVGRQQE